MDCWRDLTARLCPLCEGEREGGEGGREGGEGGREGMERLDNMTLDILTGCHPVWWRQSTQYQNTALTQNAPVINI